MKGQHCDLQWVGPGTKLGQISDALQAVQSVLKRKDEKGLEDAQFALIQQLRLHCSCLRRALRRATKAVRAHLKSATAKEPSSLLRADQKLRIAAQDVMQLVQHLMEAVEAFCQVTTACDSKDMPNDVREAWSLSYEFLLYEAERSLMKLLLDIQGDSGNGTAELREQTSVEASFLENDQEECPGSKSEMSICMTSPHLPLVPSAAAGVLERLRLEASNHRGPANGQEKASNVEGPGATSPLLEAQTVVGNAIDGLETARSEGGFHESVMDPAEDSRNEAYTNRVKVLKRHAQAASSLTPQLQRPSFLLTDLVGMVIAAIAMAIAVFSVFAATHWSGSQYGVLYLTIIIGAYVIKDRLKEWGKRYLQPVAEWFGMEFPDRITNFVDSRGKTVGAAKQFCTVHEDDAVDRRVLEMRWQSSASASGRQAANPERVLVYRKRMTVRWREAARQLCSAAGMDDVMRMDLHHFCRRMAPRLEDHYRLVRRPLGSPARVGKVSCARVYHLNLIVRIRVVQTVEGLAEKGRPVKLMHLERARLVVDRSGILRLEQLGTLPLEKRNPEPAAAAISRLSQASLQKLFHPAETAERAPYESAAPGMTLPAEGTKGKQS